MNKTCIIVFTDWYEPAYKAGGPIRSIVNLVNRFKDEYDFHIFTSDRDLNEDKPLDGIEVDCWMEKDGYKIWYYSPGTMTYKRVKQVIKDVNPGKIYLNSMFSNMILPLMAAGRSGRIILAPRGMLRVSALSIKPLKKYFYLSFLRMMNVDQYITFHSTGTNETTDIKRIFPKTVSIIEAYNLPEKVATSLIPINKEKGVLHMTFVGRMHPIKNLLFLLESMNMLKGKIIFDIIATKEDAAYGDACNKMIFKLSNRFEFKMHTDLPHHAIKPILEQSHLFVLPTEGENFGHAIFESLAVGCPVLISDQTPWVNLGEQKAGFDLPLNSDAFTEHLQLFVDMDDTIWQQFRLGAWELSKAYENNIRDGNSYKMLFNH